MRFWRWLERRLLLGVLVTTGAGLALPPLGNVLLPAVPPLLAALMLVISLTFDWRAVRAAVTKPLVMLLTVVLVFGPMSLLGYGLGRGLYVDGHLAAGQALVGALPTDVSAPMLVLLARGNVALAAVLNTLVTGLSPFLVPPLFLGLTGITLEVPLVQVIVELAALILVPTMVGVTLRSRHPDLVSRWDDAYPGMSALIYLLLLLAVVAGNAGTLLGLGATALLLVLGQLVLNLAGYALAGLCVPWIRKRGERVALLFTVSKKEFSIAAAFVVTSQLPDVVAIPAVFYAVVQMITSPLAVRLLHRIWPVTERGER